jgi:hypothetical protein
LGATIIKLKPIPVPDDNVVCSSRLPSVVMAVGNVAAVDDSRRTFSMQATQYVTGGKASDAISLVILTDCETTWKPRTGDLPGVNDLVSITGTLCKIGSSVGAAGRFTATICANRISHLSRPFLVESSPSKAVFSTPASIEKEDVDALTKRLLKYNASDTQGVPAINTSAKKRKVGATEDDKEIQRLRGGKKSA